MKMIQRAGNGMDYRAKNTMIKETIKIANELDSRGLFKEADFLDNIIIFATLNPRDRYEALMSHVETNKNPNEAANAVAAVEKLKNKYPDINFESKEEMPNEGAWSPESPESADFWGIKEEEMSLCLEYGVSMNLCRQWEMEGGNNTISLENFLRWKEEIAREEGPAPDPIINKPEWWDRRYKEEPHFANWVDETQAIFNSVPGREFIPNKNVVEADSWKEEIDDYPDKYIDPIVDLLNLNGAHITLIDDRVLVNDKEFSISDGSTHPVKVPVTYWPSRNKWGEQQWGQDKADIPTPDEMLLYHLKGVVENPSELEKYKVLIERYKDNSEWHKIVRVAKRRLEKTVNNPRKNMEWNERGRREVREAADHLKALEEFGL